MTVAADADIEGACAFAARIDAPTLIDAEGDLARTLGFRAIPNGFCFDREGRLVGEKVTGFDIREDATRELVHGWLRATGAVAPPRVAADAPPAEAMGLFASGARAMNEGRRDDGLRAWAQAYERDRRNFIVRKQIWRALYPERFGDPIDLAWQRKQIAREDFLGFRAANPGLPR